MADDAPGISVRVPEFTWHRVPLFAGFEMTLAPGSWTCLLGASGTGKSTLLRLISGLLDGGEITADDGNPVVNRLAMMAQQDGLLPWLTVIDNVTIGFRLRGVRAGDAALMDRAQALLEKVGLADVAGSYPATLSGGMRQRVALARTLMEDRPIVLMDEPFSALDTITRHRLQDMVAELFADRTVLLVTHSPLEALRLGHAIHVIGGMPARIEATITPAGSVPRGGSDEAILRHQGELLDRLAEVERAYEAREAGHAGAGKVSA